jgi:hypothetical protein
VNRFQSLRLAQFWHTRLNPLRLTQDTDAPVFIARVFEAAGWLIEGVFCGFFDRRQAEVIWARFRPVVAACKDPEESMVTEFLRSQVAKLMVSSSPFPESAQMTRGPQMMFELPLFSQALLLGDRLATSRLANECTDYLYSASDTGWEQQRASWVSVSAGRVVEKLTEPLRGAQDAASLLAGYLLLLEHMEASRSFFRYARERSTRQTDFDSYCQRIGGLNAWRVPLVDFQRRRRFDQLRDLFEFAIRDAIRKELPSAKWSDVEGALRQQITSLSDTWEAQHSAAFLVRV